MLDSHQLNVFLVAAETLNFTRAAQRLHMSQPSVSQHIQNLEKHFRTDLFLRAGRNLQLTDAGLALVPAARKMVRNSIQIEEMMASLQGDVFGHLIVGCSITPGKYILPQLLANFHRQYPKVRVTCQVSSQLQATQKLCDGEINFVLTSHLESTCRDIEFCEFMSEEILLIAPLNHPWSQRGEIGSKELYEADFITREEESGTYIVARDALNEIDMSVNELNTFLVLGNSEAIALAVQEGLGVGFVSSTVVERLVPGRVAPIKITDLEIKRKIYFGRHLSHSKTKAQTSFWNFITNLDIPISHTNSFQVLLEKSVDR
jgi:DNA-binding transcriptional LysR family regulator